MVNRSREPSGERRSWRGARVLRAALGSGPPTQEFGRRGRRSGLTETDEAWVLDLVLRTGEALIGTGAPVAEVTVAMQRMAAGLGVESCQIDITFNSITASIDREEGALTRVRVVEARTADYTRLASLTALVEDVAGGGVALSDAHRQLDAILTARHPFRRWVVTVALGTMAAGVAVLLGGGWQVAAVAAGTTVVIDRVLRYLRHRNLPYLFQQATGSAIATLVALFLLWGQGRAGWDLGVLPPSLVVASGIVVLLAGLSLVGSAQDAISGYPLTAAARSFEVVLYTAGIVVGIGFVLDIGSRVGIPLQIGDIFSYAPAPWVQVIAASVIAGSWAVASYARPRTALLAGAIGALGVLINSVLGVVGLGAAGRAFGGALVIGLVAGVVARRSTAPALVLTVCGITPMLPGLSIYAAMFDIVDSDEIFGGASLLIQAIAVGVALAAGVTLGEHLARGTRRQADRWHEALARRARGTRI